MTITDGNKAMQDAIVDITTVCAGRLREAEEASINGALTRDEAKEEAMDAARDYLQGISRVICHKLIRDAVDKLVKDGFQEGGQVGHTGGVID